MTGIDTVDLIKSVGYLGIFSFILLENSIPILFFLPGDTLLLTAGFLASQNYLNIEILMAGGFVTAVLGYMLGYFLGHKVGRSLFKNGESRFIKPEHLERTKGFYDKYGSLSLLLARFLPLRACVCFTAGAVDMRYGVFMLYNAIGAIIWGVMLPLIGFYVGQIMPIHNLETLALLPAAGVVGMFILVPFLLHRLRRKPAEASKADSD